MKNLTFIAVAAFISSSLGAEENKYDKLLSYEGVTVREVRKDGIRIMHNGGFATIPIENLPENVRKELGMSTDGVEEHRNKIALEKAEEARNAQIAAKNKKILSDAYLHIALGQVLQVVDDGILLHVQSTWDGTHSDKDQYETRSYKTGTALSGYRTVSRKEFIGTKKTKNTRDHDNWLIFVSCNTDNLVDGGLFFGDVWANGKYTYTTALGSRKTIPKYTSNSDDIITKP